MSQPLEEYRYRMEAILSCLTILYSPAGCISSIDEYVQANRDDLVRDVTIDALFPTHGLSDFDLEISEDDQNLIFPLLTPRKGRLVTIEDLAVSSGSSISRLAHAEHQRVSECMLSERLWQTFSWWIILDAGLAKETLRSIQSKLHELVSALPVRGQEILDELFDSSGRLRAYPGSLRPRDEHRLFRLARLLAERYLVLVEVNGQLGDRVSITYTYRHHFKKELHIGRLEYIKEFLGGSPSHRRFPIPLARRTGDYHFRMTADDNYYCHLQSAYEHPSGKELTRPAEPNTTSAVPELGALSYAHIYVQDGWRSRERLDAGVTFYELPLGSAGRSWVAVFTTFLIASLLLGLHAMSSGSSVSASDIPALLVALVASVSVVIGPMADSTSVPSSALLSRIILFVSTVFGDSFAVWWLLSGARIRNRESNLGAFVSILKGWGGIAIVSVLLLTLIYATIRCVRIVLKYRFVANAVRNVY